MSALTEMRYLGLDPLGTMPKKKSRRTKGKPVDSYVTIPVSVFREIAADAAAWQQHVLGNKETRE